MRLNRRKLFNKFLFLFRLIKFDLSFVILIILAIILNEIRLYFSFFSFVLLHEFSHFFIAKKHGYLPQKIKLSFFGASLEGYDDFYLYDEIKIILAGPIFNFLVVIFCYLSFWFYPDSYELLNPVLVSNIFLFVFNVMPIYPLDCGRLILAFLSIKFNRVKALKMTKTISFFVLVILFIVYLISLFFYINLTFGIVLINLAILLFDSTKNTSYKRSCFIYKKYRFLANGLAEKNVYVNSDIDERKLFKYIDENHFTNFYFLNKNLEVVNSLSEVEFLRNQGLI